MEYSYLLSLKEIQPFKNEPQSFMQQIISLFSSSNETTIHEEYIPSFQDISYIMEKMYEFNGFCIDNHFLDRNGIYHFEITLGGLKPSYRQTTTPHSVGKHFLVTLRGYLKTTRNIDSDPFLEVLTPNQLVFGIPTSIHGLKILYQLQEEQRRKNRLRLAEHTQKEQLAAQAVKNFHQKQG